MDIPKALNSCNQGQEPFYHSDRSAFTTVIPNFQGILTNNDTTNIHFGNFPLGESFFNIEQPVNSFNVADFQPLSIEFNNTVPLPQNEFWKVLPFVPASTFFSAVNDIQNQLINQNSAFNLDNATEAPILSGSVFESLSHDITHTIINNSSENGVDSSVSADPFLAMPILTPNISLPVTPENLEMNDIELQEFEPEEVIEMPTSHPDHAPREVSTQNTPRVYQAVLFPTIPRKRKTKASNFCCSAKEARSAGWDNRVMSSTKTNEKCATMPRISHFTYIQLELNSSSVMIKVKGNHCAEVFQLFKDQNNSCTVLTNTEKHGMIHDNNFIDTAMAYVFTLIGGSKHIVDQLIINRSPINYGMDVEKIRENSVIFYNGISSMLAQLKKPLCVESLEIRVSLESNLLSILHELEQSFLRTLIISGIDNCNAITIEMVKSLGCWKNLKYIDSSGMMLLSCSLADFYHIEHVVVRIQKPSKTEFENYKKTIIQRTQATILNHFFLYGQL
ncbi:DUF38 domain-containing protein [Caenorhabditis elegans]|uniref:DUF38 domain-containing protein n=1 Tax=Caenorhabditis elegans TaxID=6239 RepID=G5ED69_CAEEL|nr:DUF38 domain-containing protein [Caenorhabditis elegans]CAD44109.2 DUF38 domain-containing protein [Caenorhabditis elegans]